MEKTLPKRRFPEGYEPDINTLAGGRYGTLEMGEIWGPEQTFAYSLRVQAQSAKTLSRLHPDIVPKREADEIYRKASLKHVRAERIRELEERTGHDVIAINTALEEILSHDAATHVNKLKTSTDTTQPARASQQKRALEEIADSVENLRDITLEKALELIEIPHMDTTHLYDALPTVAGRPFAFYAEMLQSGLNFLKFVHNNSIKGKWGDATGNHHQASDYGVDGMKLQEEFCKKLGIGWMDAPAQLPGLEFEADIVYAVSRIGMTVENLARYIASGFSDDVNVFVDINPKKRKGSSGMPHKDTKGGNRTTEEQDVSMANKLKGWMTTALANCEMPYARTLYASANSRIDSEDLFKFTDHCIRNLSTVVYYLGVNEERSLERIMRTRGIVTSSRVMAHLTDYRRTNNPMARSDAHNLLGELATKSYQQKIPFLGVLLANEEVTSRIDKETLAEITDPLKYIGQSKEIIKTVYGKYHGKRTLKRK
jgi:adenylosuccinate lyase